jgi:hypothetical protein
MKNFQRGMAAKLTKLDHVAAELQPNMTCGDTMGSKATGCGRPYRSYVVIFRRSNGRTDRIHPVICPNCYHRYVGGENGLGRISGWTDADVANIQRIMLEERYRYV